ncbi:hypothetical protein BTO30_04010 [Domibacillus antri]|uniref:Uncharacterized protein n=1 Tax=Domibacillus antri TaxID=1714264 RepID=A0A1Q8Q725_9BACI|nr:hypothetical protein [Domibacillus antri]OLN23144.1 hypothetical protein BTO30_04010 [Domibacillus antri]
MEDFQVVVEMVNGDKRVYQFHHTDEQEIIQEIENSSVWLEIPHHYETHYIQTDKIKKINIMPIYCEDGGRENRILRLS